LTKEEDKMTKEEERMTRRKLLLLLDVVLDGSKFLSKTHIVV